MLESKSHSSSNSRVFSVSWPKMMSLKLPRRTAALESPKSKTLLRSGDRTVCFSIIRK